MGAFNTLRCSRRCHSCGQDVELRLQFKYGDTWQYEYAIGDMLRWGGNDTGVPNAARVVLDAVSEPCPSCGFSDDFEVFVEYNELKYIQRSTGSFDFVAAQEPFIVLGPDFSQIPARRNRDRGGRRGRRAR